MSFSSVSFMSNCPLLLSMVSWYFRESNSVWGVGGKLEGGFYQTSSVKAESCLSSKEELGSVQSVPHFTLAAEE